ncbi:MAG: hypothetical protein WCN81_16750, partial [Actinomycetes bacterium]
RMPKSEGNSKSAARRPSLAVTPGSAHPSRPMNLPDFTNEQREALLDLLVLAMYADGHLASAEEARSRAV